MRTEYTCEKCGARYSSEADCRACESRQTGRAVVTKVRYRKNGVIPSEIYISFSTKPEDESFKYTLDSYSDCLINDSNNRGFADD